MELHLHIENLSARLEEAQGAAQRLQSALATEASNAKVGSFTGLPLLHVQSQKSKSGACWCSCCRVLRCTAGEGLLAVSGVIQSTRAMYCVTNMRLWLPGCERAGGGS